VNQLDFLELVAGCDERTRELLLELGEEAFATEVGEHIWYLREWAKQDSAPKPPPTDQTLIRNAAIRAASERLRAEAAQAGKS
jgi:hypothetical protein